MKKLLSIICLSALVFACRKNSDQSNTGGIRLSQNAIDFDTLFTTTGSVTKGFKIFNDRSSSITVDLALQQGNSSMFTFNADGRKGPVVNGVEVYAKDSIYVFLSANIEENSQLQPFLVSDTLTVSLNGVETNVALSASGQNAQFFRSYVITADTTWTSRIPIVIVGGLLVAENVTLTIDQGTNIYLHADAPLIVDGTLKALGKQYDSTRVRFTGDRLDDYYRDLPASWPGIYFTEKSSGNVLEFAEIKNAYQGVVSEGNGNFGGNNIEIRQCIIDNCYDAGIIGVNTSIVAANCLVSNCGKNVVLVMGGKYDFKHCTLASFSNNYIPHKQPVLTIADYLKKGEQLLFGDLSAQFTNCIMWGGNSAVEDEVAVIREGTQPFASSFVNCLWKVKSKPGNSEFTSLIENEEPQFLNVAGTGEYNFRLKEGSPAINKGAVTSITIDLEGRARTGAPDIGAFESTF